MTRQCVQIVMLIALTISMIGCSGCRKDVVIPGPGEGQNVGTILQPLDPDSGNGTDVDGIGGPGKRGVKGERIPEGMMKTVYFDFDKAMIRADQIEDLEKSADFLKNNPGKTVLIEGHCDERGTNEYNMGLGEDRARGIKSFLVSRGVPADRLLMISRGEESPAVEGTGEAAWAKNRRCEFYNYLR